MTGRKGVLLAGGRGTRLYPATLAVSKQLLPVYDKPLVYYPLSTLMSGGLRDILILSTPSDLPQFQRLLGDGSAWGIRLSYAAQPQPGGIAQALLLAQEFLAGDACTLILGDNLFHGEGLAARLETACRSSDGATLFCTRVENPARYGVMGFDAAGNPQSLEEKPAQPASPYAVTGLYVYDHRASDWAQTLKPSARGELEITDLNRLYLEAGALRVERLGSGYAWFDAGTHDSLLEASAFVQALERRQGLKIGSPEVQAWRRGWIGTEDVLRLAGALGSVLYAEQLRQIVEEERAPLFLEDQ